MAARNTYSASTISRLYESFSDADALEHWKVKVLNGRVNYWVEEAAQGGYLRAKADSSCSALYRRVKIRVEDEPFLSWRWRALQFPEEGPGEDGEVDYVARVYVIFPGLTFGGSRFLEYVWVREGSVNTVLSAPQDNVKRLVIRVGPAENDMWLAEERNVLTDYERAFGEQPRKKARAIALMSDGDSTGSVAEAMFDDIRIGYVP